MLTNTSHYENMESQRRETAKIGTVSKFRIISQGTIYGNTRRKLEVWLLCLTRCIPRHIGHEESTLVPRFGYFRIIIRDLINRRIGAFDIWAVKLQMQAQPNSLQEVKRHGLVQQRSHHVAT